MAAVIATIRLSCWASLISASMAIAYRGLAAFFAGTPVSRTNGGQAWNQTGFFIAGSYPRPFFVMTWRRTGPFIFSTFSRVGSRCSKLWPSIGPATKSHSSNSSPGRMAPLANSSARRAIFSHFVSDMRDFPQ